MSALTTTETQSMPSTERGKRGNRRRARGGPDRNTRRHNGNNMSTADQVAPQDALEEAQKVPTTVATTANDFSITTTTKDEGTPTHICWICAEPVKYHSLSACNHRTCHVCALRLRALYKKLECAFCKEPQSTVIFTTSPDADFASYTPDAIPYKDAKLAIFFETEEMMEETLILLRFTCPGDECDYTASGWGDLRLHTRATHGKLLCDLCIRFKKVFSHEHVLYPPNVLPLHFPSIPHRPSKQPHKEPIEGGVHPRCEFCNECFFGDDELFVHMRERHEECFLCKRNEIQHQYFQDYENLELHFSQAHFVCTNTVCQAQKFVVFDSELDLKAHQVEVHGADMSSKDRRDARRVQTEFEFDDASGGGRRGRRERGERERDPPPRVQVHPRPGGRRREAFGAHLTTEGVQTVTQVSVPSGRASPPRDDVDPLVVERHAAFITRLQAIAPNPNHAVTAVKAAMRGYRANESSARDLISTVWNVLDHDLDVTAGIINAVVDLLDEEEKKRGLLGAWNGFKIEQREEFPDLVPTAVGSGYAGIASGRVLNAKHATISRSSQQSSRQVWDRVAQAASASSSSTARVVPGASTPSSTSSTVHVDRFPPLASAASTPALRQPQPHTRWSNLSVGSPSSSTSTTTVTTSTTTVRPSVSPKKRGKGESVRTPPTLSAAAFPGLPTTQTRAKPPVGGNSSLRHILKDVVPAGSAWKANGASAGAGADREVGGETSGVQVEPVTGAGGPGKGKKGKGKQKQTLFTMGTFPT